MKDSKFRGKLTIQGELDKLAANIAIGRNTAGVHYYLTITTLCVWASGSRFRSC